MSISNVEIVIPQSKSNHNYLILDTGTKTGCLGSNGKYLLLKKKNACLFYHNADKPKKSYSYIEY